MSRMPSTSIATRSSTRSARAAVSISSRRGFPAGGRISVSRCDGFQGHGFASEIECRGRHGDDLLVAQMVDVQVRIAHRLGDDRAPELAAGDFGRQALGRAFGEPQREARRDASYLGDDRRHEPTADRADDAECRVARLEALEHRYVLVQRFDLAADGARPVEDAHAELGWRGAAPAAHEQLHAELALELTDVLGDVRLDRVQAVGGGRETAFLGDREERLELTKIHLATPLRHVGRTRPSTSQSSALEMDSISITPLTDRLVIHFTRRVTRRARGAGVPPTGSRAPSHRPVGGEQMTTIEAISSLIFTGPLTWTNEAACQGQTRLFFAPAGERPEARAVREVQARSVCAVCPALLECREWARENREYGFWGGESEEERAAAGFRVDMPVGRVARYPRGNGEPVQPRESRIA